MDVNSSTLLKKKHFKKRFRWYGILGLLTIFLFIPIIADLGSIGFDIYFRLFINLLFGLVSPVVGLWVIITPFRGLYKKGVTIDHKRIILGWFFKVFGIVLCALGTYALLVPIAIASFHFLVMKEPVEVITDQVVYVNSSGRYVTSYTNCIYIVCSIELKNNPARDLNYLYSPDIQLNKEYTFYILPSSDIVVASQLFSIISTSTSLASSSTLSVQPNYPIHPTFISSSFSGNTLQEYDSYLNTSCRGAMNPNDEELFVSCTYAVMLNDELATGTIKSFAEQEQLAIDERQAMALSDTELISDLTTGLKTLNQQYSVSLAMKMGGYSYVYLNRGLNDLTVNTEGNALAQKLGSCWDIPEGECHQ